METNGINSLIEKIEHVSSLGISIILIEDDLTETYLKQPQIDDNFKKLIKGSRFGYCFINSTEKYFSWEFNKLSNSLIIQHKIKGKARIYLHDKLSSSSEFIIF